MGSAHDWVVVAEMGRIFCVGYWVFKQLSCLSSRCVVVESREIDMLHEPISLLGFEI